MAKLARTEQEAVFDFMVVRPPDSVAPGMLCRHYVHDDVLVAKEDGAVARVPVDLCTQDSPSQIGRDVFDAVFCRPDAEGVPVPARIAELLDGLLRRLLLQDPQSGKYGEISSSCSAISSLAIQNLDRCAYAQVDGHRVLLQDRLDQFPEMPFVGKLQRALAALDRERQPATNGQAGKWDKAGMVHRLETILGTSGRGLRPLVLKPSGAYTVEFRMAKRALFDALYLLYVMRRRMQVNLEHIMDGLRVLHVLEALAFDQFIGQARSSGLVNKGDRALLAVLSAVYPGLDGWDLRTAPSGFPLVDGVDALGAYLSAQPVVHPIFARLFWYSRPFNDIRPIGVGDLKVVRQWLTAYLPGEISHVHNILKGESKVRDHRRLERSEDTFALTEAQGEETTRETQSTRRFEVKTEAEDVVRTTLGVTANANVSYNGATVVASVGAGFSYNRASEDHTKSATNFARDVMDKAITRVESNTAAQRTSTRVFETEEKNRQVFDNVDGEHHVSGMYRWIDKEYTAQVFNYGKRLMFEFLVPEPGEFWAESKLRAFEDTLQIPQPPETKPVEHQVELGFTWDQIDELRFGGLAAKYDLREFGYPVRTKSAVMRNADTRSYLFGEKDIGSDPPDHSIVINSEVEGAKGYRIAKVMMNGDAHFHDRGTKGDSSNYNGITLLIGHRRMGIRDDWPMEWTGEHWDGPPEEPYTFVSDEATLEFRFRRKIKTYQFRVDLELELDPATYAQWQHSVYDAVYAVEQKEMEALNKAEKQDYDARLAEYRNRIAQVKATTVAELLQGGSSAANRTVMDEEIKKHCLTMISKEFDTDASGDWLANADALGDRIVDAQGTRFCVHEQPELLPPTEVRFEPTHRLVHYPAINIGTARDKGTVIQFLEQAFEWERISYIFYPYFWADMPRWIELMNRADDADPFFTAFLRAGMARVLVAVSPAYEGAVLHYLATREPWSGGPAPVIGDALFVPLYEEVRAQTDDRLGGVPEGEPWTFTIPTSLVYLHGSGDPLPDLAAEREAREKQRAARDKAAQKSQADQGAAQPNGHSAEIPSRQGVGQGRRRP
jgi:hypothetical protein